jgi:hypothetical protein
MTASAPVTDPQLGPKNVAGLRRVEIAVTGAASPVT